MAILDLINDYSNGATGTFVDNGGNTITYTVSTSGNATATYSTVNDGAQVFPVAGAGTGTDGDPVTISLSAPVIGLGISMTGMQDDQERLSFNIDGTEVDLQTLVNNGDAVLALNGEIINGDLTTTAGVSATAEIYFKFSIQTLTLTGIDAGAAQQWFAFDLQRDTTITCFEASTGILTRKGYIPAGDLQSGDQVMTLDRGYQSIAWVGSRTLGKGQLAMNPKLRPIRIRAGALGPNQPRRDMLVSRQHRILVRSAVADRMFGKAEILVPAISLIEAEGVEIAEDVDKVTYVHFMCGQHEIVYSEGALTESFYPGPQALKTIDLAAREEIFTLFPELRADGIPVLPAAARYFASNKESKALLTRIRKNNKTLVEGALTNLHQARCL